MTQNLNTKPTLIIVDDHLIFQQGLKSMIEGVDMGTVIGEATNGKQFIDLLNHCVPDIVLMDIDMPQMNGMEATRKALEMKPDLKIVALTMFDDEEYYHRMIDLGVKGFILKSTGIAELEKAIHDVMQGESYFSNELLRKIIQSMGKKHTSKSTNQNDLSDRELEVLAQICAGSTTDEIAQTLNISPKTVKSHRSNILDKTACKNTASLILYAVKHKLISI